MLLESIYLTLPYLTLPYLTLPYIMYNEPVVTIDQSAQSNMYVVRTPNHTINVDKFLFVAINTFDIHEKVRGNVVDFLEFQKPFQQPKASEVAVAVSQWDPNTPAWYLDELDKTGATYNVWKLGLFRPC